MTVRKRSLTQLFLLLIPLVILTILALSYMWNLKNLAFSLENVLHRFPEHVASRSSLSSDETTGIFKQRFVFLDEGRQCYAFASEDGRYVLKLFKVRHLKKNRWLKDSPFLQPFISSEKKRQVQAEWQNRFQASCMRYGLAFAELASETGLLMLHFQPNKLPKTLLTLAAASKNFEIDLASVPFLLQEKGELVPRRLAALLKNGQREVALAAVENLRLMLVKRAQKGFTDPRQCFSVNFAFVGEKPLQIDVGCIQKQPEILKAPNREIERVTHNLNAWVQRHFPELATPDSRHD